MNRTLLLSAAACFALASVSVVFAQSDLPPDQQQPRDAYGNPVGNQPAASAPSRLTLQQGTYITVRMNQTLTSNRNQSGDAFFASLAAPLVVNGIVVAQRGQTVAGRITEAERAGRVKGTSRLGLQVTELTLADGQQIALETQLIGREGNTSQGRDAGAVASTTALGAIIGAGADRGTGAAIGAGAGAAVGLIGVLLTRGDATVIRPESILTFRLERSIDIDTSRAAHAFRYPDSQDYERAPVRPSYADADAPPPYPRRGYGGVWGPGWGSGVSVVIGTGRGRWGRRGWFW